MKAIGVLFVSAALACLVAVVPATAAPKPQVLTFDSIETSESHPADAKTVIRDKDVSGKKQIGHDVLTCLVKTPKLLACSIVISLAKGTVSANFNVGITANGTPTSPTGKGQISGGSGAYKGARGDFAFKDLNKAGTNTQLTLTIR